MAAKGCLFVYVLAAVVCFVAGQVGSICRPNERFLTCGGCQPTCKDPSPTCTGVCRTGCYCEKDEVRNETGHCVKMEHCPPATSAALHTSEPRSTETECPENEEYKFCEPCNRTCDNPNPICPAQCVRGCFCVDDLVRNKEGRCVNKENCPSVQKKESTNYIKPIPYQMTCGPHQVYNDCQTCEKTCSDPKPVCTTTCSAGCFCEKGYLRSPDGQCVLLGDCPKGWYFRGLGRA